MNALSDTTRGLIIGVFVGLFGGMMVGGTIVSLVREYVGSSGVAGFIVNYGMIFFIIIGIVLGAVGAYRMLESMEREDQEETN